MLHKSYSVSSSLNILPNSHTDPIIPSVLTAIFFLRDEAEADT